MGPAQLRVESFKSYPPEARALAAANLALLQNLPLGFAPFLLREIIVFDWKFPYEQSELTHQLAYLSKLTEEQRQKEMAPFATLKLSEKLDSNDWVNQPAQFLEQLSAHLWATQQMDGFRAASENYVRKFNATLPAEELPVPRLGIAVFGEGVSGTEYKLFRKLRRSGVYFSHMTPANGMEAIAESLKVRAAAHSVPYAHWCIEGGAITASLPGFTCVDYDGLAGVRGKLSAIMLSAYGSTKFDPEKLRTTLATVTPETAGMKDSGDGALDGGFGDADLQHHLCAMGSARSASPGAPADDLHALCAAAEGPHDGRVVERRPEENEGRSRRLYDRRRYGRLLHMGEHAAVGRRGEREILSMV